MGVEKVIDRAKLAKTLHTILDTGMEMLEQKEFQPVDFHKIKLIRTMGSIVSASVMMVQQETAQERNVLIAQRMKQLGYDTPKELCK